MTDNALQTPHQFGSAGSGPGYPHGIGSYNGITGGPGADQHGGGGGVGPATPARTGVDYPHQTPNSPYFGGQQPSPRPPPVGGGHSSGPGGYSKMGPGRPGWGPMPPSSQPRFPQSMPMQQPQQPGSGPTPTLNQLLQSGPSGPELRHPSGYSGSEYGPGGPMPLPNRGQEEFGGGSMGFGMPHPGWGNQQRMGNTGQYPQQMMPSQSMDSVRYDMARRGSMQSGGMNARYPMGNQLSDIHTSQFSPNSQPQQGPPPHMSNVGGQIQPSPSTTPQSQLSDHASSAQSSPPHQQQQQPTPPTTSKSKSKKHQQESRSQQITQQESSSSDEVNTDASGSSRSGPGSNTGATVSTSQPQQPRPGSAYGLPTAPSPAGSVGSRSNTPASIQGNMIGSPSAAAMHDVQNRIMSPGHPQGGHPSQQMMPPPSMMPSHAGSAYPGPGGMGKLHSSGGMMHMSGPGGGGVQANTGMYGGPMYGNQPSAGGCAPAPNYSSHPLEPFNGPNQMGPNATYRGNYGGPYPPGSVPSGIDNNFPPGAYSGSAMGPTGLTHSGAVSQTSSEGPNVSQAGQHHAGKPGELTGSSGSEDQRSTGKSDLAASGDNQSSSSENARSGQQPMNMDGGMSRLGPSGETEGGGLDGMAARRGMPLAGAEGMPNEGGMPPGIENMHGRPGQSPMGMEGMPWRSSQPNAMEGMPGRNGPYMVGEGMPNRSGPKAMTYAMPVRPNQFMGMNGMSPRPSQPPPFGSDGMLGRPGHPGGMDGMSGRPGQDMDGMPARMDQPVGPDGMSGARPGSVMDVMPGRPTQSVGMDGMMYGRPGPPQHPGLETGRPGQQMSMESMMRRPGHGIGGIDPATGRPMPPVGMDIGPGRLGMPGMSVRPEEPMGIDDMPARMNQPGGMPGRFGMENMTGGRPPMHPVGMEQMHMRPMQPMSMENLQNRFGSPMRVDGMDRRTGGPPDGMGVGPSAQPPGNYGRPYPNYPNAPQPGMRSGFGESEMGGSDSRMIDRNHMDSFSGAGKAQMPPGHGMHPEGPGNQFGEFGDRRFPPPNGEAESMKRGNEQPMTKMFEGDSAGPDAGVRMPQGSDGRMDFMPGSGPGMGGGRPGAPNDGMQMKCGPGGFEVDEFGRPKMAGAKMDKPASVSSCLKF